MEFKTELQKNVARQIAEGEFNLREDYRINDWDREHQTSDEIQDYFYESSKSIFLSRSDDPFGLKNLNDKVLFAYAELCADYYTENVVTNRATKAFEVADLLVDVQEIYGDVSNHPFEGLSLADAIMSSVDSQKRHGEKIAREAVNQIDKYMSSRYFGPNFDNYAQDSGKYHNRIQILHVIESVIEELETYRKLR